MYDYMSVANNTLLYTWKLLREWMLKFLSPRGEKICNYVCQWMLPKLIVKIILQYLEYQNIMLYILNLHNFTCQ